MKTKTAVLLFVFLFAVAIQCTAATGESGVLIDIYPDMIYVMAYYTANATLHHIPNATLKVYIDNNYIGTFATGSYLAIPTQYRTPGNHTVKAVYEGGLFPPAEEEETYYVSGQAANNNGSTETYHYNYTKNHVTISGSGTSSAQFVDHAGSFQGYTFNAYNVTVETWRQWWEFETYNDFYVKMNISDGTNSLLAVTKLSGSTSFFGTLQTFHVLVGSGHNTDYESITLAVPPFRFYEAFGIAGWNPEEFTLYVVPEANQTKVIWMWAVHGENTAITQTLPIVLQGKDVTITLTYEHSGNGYFDIYANDEIGTPSVPWHKPFQEGVTNWINEIIGVDLSYAADILLLIITLFVGIVRVSLPLMGAIVFLWIIDTIYTAVTTGEIRLIGEMFMRIYEITMAIWRTLVGIIQVIWDLITFWS